jgi:hypothetical protein
LPSRNSSAKTQTIRYATTSSWDAPPDPAERGTAHWLGIEYVVLLDRINGRETNRDGDEQTRQEYERIAALQEQILAPLPTDRRLGGASVAAVPLVPPNTGVE